MKFHNSKKLLHTDKNFIFKFKRGFYYFFLNDKLGKLVLFLLSQAILCLKNKIKNKKKIECIVNFIYKKKSLKINKLVRERERKLRWSDIIIHGVL